MGTTRALNIGVLTSSRADFGIYLPLLRLMKGDKAVNPVLIVFGTHLSKFHGYTVAEIEAHGFEVPYRISSMLQTDDPNSIATSYALTALKFSDFWEAHQKDFDIILTLGDRYEMAAAVASAIPYCFTFAHFHGGETTLGAIDNIYRHFITLASKLHFVSAEAFKKKIAAVTGSATNCFVTGSLSLDNLSSIRLLKKSEFLNEWGIDLAIATVLVTVHPETVSYEKNIFFLQELSLALTQIASRLQVVITMPNADTCGTLYRNEFQKLRTAWPANIFLIENFGTQSYFTCMKYSKLMIGNTSSGIIEAASFQKYAINIGDRQKGRLAGSNVIHVPFDHKKIITAVNKYINRKYEGQNIYFKSNASSKALKEIKYFCNVL